MVDRAGMQDSVRRGELSLEDSCQYVKGVGPSRAALLRHLGVENVNDLLTHFPRKYYDRRHLLKIAHLQPGSDATFIGKVLTATQRRPRGRRAMITAAVGDDTGVIQAVWFNQPYLLQHLKPGAEVVISGQLRFFRGQRQVTNPEFEIVGDDLDQELLAAGRIVPVYRLTSGVTQRFLRTLMMRTIETYRDATPENLPEALVRDAGLLSRHDAIRSIHFPADSGAFEKASKRIKLEELFYMQLVLSLARRRRMGSGRAVRLQIPFALEKQFLSELGFELTGAQRRVIDEIHADLSGSSGMNRLLQGDVGSGKTVVAGATMLSAVEAGLQAAMMVPTEILAMQHFHTLAPRFERLGARVALLVGSLKTARRRELHAAINRGDTDVVIGTHALIQDGVEFRNLGAVVIDEQHRFGVRQRAAFLRGERTPHTLVMTATPIPRTLALTAYADLDISVLDEMPSTRAAVKTRVVPPSKRPSMYEYIRERQKNGEQAYLLYPLIEETEKQDLEAAETAYKDLVAGPLRGVPIGLLHGRLSAADKARVMKAFAAGDLRVLVTTTVIEVGVHVPSATIMAIHHPERFGLSQLHQLRGRVGRGGREGFCFLLAGEHMAPETLQRLEVLVRESDGFRIAEEDLRLRGPGEFLGVRQHGVPGFRLANPLRDTRLVEEANRAVRELLESDPALGSPSGKLCRQYLRALLADDTDLPAVA